MHQSFILLFAILAARWVAGQDAPVETDTPSQTTQKEPPSFQGEDTPYQIVPNTDDVPAPEGGDVDIMNKLGTWLYGYTGCKDFPGAKGKIDEAYYDSWVMANTKGVKSDINWNEASALEFLGAPGLNKDKQPQIQAVMANIATVIYSYKNPLFQHYIKVRCDDPAKKCQKRPDNDPCQPNDPDDKDYPFINFCQGFLDRRNLADAITYGKALKSPENLKLSNYDNRAAAFYHELTHLDLAADSPKPNPRVTDLQIDIKLGQSGRTYTTLAYSPLGAKLLARWQGAPGGSSGSTGYYVQKNADNLAYYALAKYVMTKNDNVYPHLPLVTNELDGPPYPRLPGTLVEFVAEDNKLYINTTDDIQTFSKDYGLDLGSDYPGCSDDVNEDAAAVAGSTITIDGIAPNDAYPDDYNKQVENWIADLTKAIEGENPPEEQDPPAEEPKDYEPGTCSFHLKETETCLQDDRNLYAIINLKDGKGNAIGDTQVDSKNPIGDGINAGAGLEFKSKLPKPLVVTGEHRNDYIQFTYGDISWQSKTPAKG
ncbi:MAG: hypothetical protein Q9194_003851, partial [Teloschistes cf. exilis]